MELIQSKNKLSAEINEYHPLRICARFKVLRLTEGVGQKNVPGFSQQIVSFYESGKWSNLPVDYLIFWIKKGYNANWILAEIGSSRINY